MLSFMYHYTRTPTLPFLMSGLPLRRFSNERLHTVNGLSNNTFCFRIIQLVKTRPTLIPGSNQVSHFLLLQREHLRDQFCSLLREHYYWLQMDPYHWLQREPLPAHPPVVLMWIMIMEVHQVDLAVTAGTWPNIIPNLTYPPVNGWTINKPRLPNSY